MTPEACTLVVVFKRRQALWGPVVVLVPLGVALGLAVANGSIGDSVIIAAVLGLALLFYGVMTFLDLKHRDRGRQGG
jgi:hypothetical protein